MKEIPATGRSWLGQKTEDWRCEVLTCSAGDLFKVEQPKLANDRQRGSRCDREAHLRRQHEAHILRWVARIAGHLQVPPSSAPKGGGATD